MKAVIFGWKRDYLTKYLDDCEVISNILTKEGYDIYTGGGSGFMEKGNSGAFKENKQKSFGISVECLKQTEKANKQILSDNFIICDNFAERKKKLIDNYDIIIFFPGGMGTLDEFTEVMNLLKTGELELKTIILYGYKYWTSLITWFEFNKIKFPKKLIDGVIDSVDEFNKILLEKKNDISEESLVETNITNEEIKNYEPIFKKKNIFNPLDELDDLINIMFSNPDVLEKINFNEIINDKTNFDDSEKNNSYEDNSNNYDNESYEIYVKNSNNDSNEDDDDVIIEIVYDYSSEYEEDNEEDDDEVPIDPIDFITDSESESDSKDN